MLVKSNKISKVDVVEVLMGVYKVCPKSHEIYIYFLNLLMISVQSVNILQSTVHEHLHIFSTDSPSPVRPLKGLDGNLI